LISTDINVFTINWKHHKIVLCVTYFVNEQFPNWQSWLFIAVYGQLLITRLWSWFTLNAWRTSRQKGSSSDHGSLIPIMVSLNLIGFKLLSRQGLYAPGHCDLDLQPTDTKSIGIMYESWPTKTPIMGSLSSISLDIEWTRFLCSRSLWPCPLTYWPKNQKGSSMGHGHSWY